MENKRMKQEKPYTTLSTWGGRAQFSYRDNGNTLSLQYGNGQQYRVSAEHIERLRADHRGQLVAVFGPAPSLDAWTKTHVTRTRIATYLAPALIQLGFAERSGDRIKFL
jgi:hypothetical protein